MFLITDVFEAASVILGEELVHLILGDLYAGTLGGVPGAVLKGDKLPSGLMLIGNHTQEGLAEELANKAKFPFPHTFGRARVLLEEANLDIKDLLVKGLEEYGAKYFPKLRICTAERNQKVSVVPNQYVAFHPANKSPTQEAILATLATKVANEIEDQGLTYARNLERFRAFGMPWLANVNHRLPAVYTGEDRLRILTFVSCIALRMNGEFVDYKRLMSLHDLLTPSQR